MTTNGSLSTLNDLFRRVSSAANPRAVLWQDDSGHWQPLSSDQIYQRVRAVGRAFLQWGTQKGDRIALISENRWEWAVSDFATLAIGAVVVPIYPTLTGEQIALLLSDAGCRIAVVSTRQQYEKLNAVRSQTGIERILMMDPDFPEKGAISFSEVATADDARGSEHDPEFDALAASIRPGDLATLIYTSGTTGEPKGVMLTHGNISVDYTAAAREFTFGQQDACISFLPLSHITARVLDYVMYSFGAQLAYCSKFDKLPEAMKQIRPTVFVGVPRVYEKIRQEVEHRASLSPVKKRLLTWAIRVGTKHQETVYDKRRPASLSWKLADKLIYSKVQEAFGGQVRVFVSGGAPLGIDTTRWFASAGIAIWEGYGLTETSPVIALNDPKMHKLGSVGKPLEIVGLRIAGDGELLVKGPTVFAGYWQKPAANAEAFDVEGWFHTGDIGQLDSDGYLHITDRKKELLKTSGGKMVAPQPIESKLKNSILVGQAALVGDKHKFISVLISPNFPALEEWAQRQGIKAASRAKLVAHERVIGLYAGIVREVNAELANFETLKRFRVVAEEWSQETGELTPSMKLKRRVITARYAEAIEALYVDEATSRGE